MSFTITSDERTQNQFFQIWNLWFQDFASVAMTLLQSQSITFRMQALNQYTKRIQVLICWKQASRLCNVIIFWLSLTTKADLFWNLVLLLKWSLNLLQLFRFLYTIFTWFWKGFLIPKKNIYFSSDWRAQSGSFKWNTFIMVKWKGW